MGKNLVRFHCLRFSSLSWPPDPSISLSRQFLTRNLNLQSELSNSGAQSPNLRKTMFEHFRNFSGKFLGMSRTFPGHFWSISGIFAEHFREMSRKCPRNFTEKFQKRSGKCPESSRKIPEKNPRSCPAREGSWGSSSQSKGLCYQLAAAKQRPPKKMR